MDSNLTPQQLKILDLVDAIYDKEYYVDLFESVCKDPATLWRDPQAIRLLNDFWFKLPDTRAIRTPVFFQLCDIIEDASDEYDDNENDAPAF